MKEEREKGRMRKSRDGHLYYKLFSVKQDFKSACGASTVA